MGKLGRLVPSSMARILLRSFLLAESSSSVTPPPSSFSPRSRFFSSRRARFAIDLLSLRLGTYVSTSIASEYWFHNGLRGCHEFLLDPPGPSSLSGEYAEPISELLLSSTSAGLEAPRSGVPMAAPTLIPTGFTLVVPKLVDVDIIPEWFCKREEDGWVDEEGGGGGGAGKPNT